MSTRLRISWTTRRFWTGVRSATVGGTDTCPDVDETSSGVGRSGSRVGVESCDRKVSDVNLMHRRLCQILGFVVSITKISLFVE